MEDKPCNPIPDDNENNSVLARLLRVQHPAHYMLKIESFSLVSKILLDAKVQNYESDIFEAGGYKWKLSLYPNGDKERDGEGHISLYLVIAEAENLPLGWEVHVTFKLFVYNQIQDKYLTIGDANGTTRRFHKMKTEWGFTQLLPLSTFKDASNGYLILDKCVFGAEVFVRNCTGKGECLNLLKGLHNPHTWKINKFSSLIGEFHYSDVFTIGNRKWKLLLYPKGDLREKGKSLSLYLYLNDWETFPNERKTYATFRLRIMDQLQGQHWEISATSCFSTPMFGQGCPSFLPLSKLHDTSKGFLYEDTLIVQAEVNDILAVENFSEVKA